MITSSSYTIVNELSTFARFGYQRENLGEYLSPEDILNVKEHWNDLVVDNYIENEFKYRFRRYSRFRFEREVNALKFLGSNYYQGEDYNKLFGGQTRAFSQVSDTLVESKIFRKFLTTDFDFFQNQGLLTKSTYDIGVHQMRTITNKFSKGLVTPEGIHKDGHFAFAIHMINRSNVADGITRLYDNEMNHLTEFTLTKFGETVFVHDDMLYHEVTPVTNVQKDIDGFRDILIIEFY